MIVYLRNLNVKKGNPLIVSRGGTMAKLSGPYRTLSSLSLTHPARRLVIPTAATSASHSFTTSSQRPQPSNVGNLGLAEKDAVVGKQAPESLTINGIKARREKAGKLVAPTASYSDSDMFKSPQAFDKPKARRWDRESTCFPPNPLPFSSC
ncbi:hypothetical protein F4677DRAFT_419365 [Hypoxylon crocopeplum]|nr:hypothetical protein F4677DRAFT_419365 [Hypoxylon crocopeplum]